MQEVQEESPVENEAKADAILPGETGEPEVSAAIDDAI